MTPSRKKTSAVQPPGRKRTPGHGSTSLLDLVRRGVEKFVLKDANMAAFMRAVRAAAKGGANSTHPLTGAAFRRIVREAVQKRKRRMGKPYKGQSSTGGKRST